MQCFLEMSGTFTKNEMRIFVTGATGWIGSAITRELLAEGYRVLGLARKDSSAEALARQGVDVHRGDITDIDSLVAGTRAADGVIHTAFIHDFTRFEANVETDRQAVEAMAGALEGSGKPFVIASGIGMVSHGRGGSISTEEDAPVSQDIPRAASETIMLAVASLGVRSSIVRLPPTVHGAGDHGFVPMLIDIARSKGVSAFIGDGSNRWPAVHRLDAAHLFRLALENAAPGTRLHAVAEVGIPMRLIAEAIGAGLGIPVRSVSQDEAPAHFGWIGRFAGMDTPSSSALTRKEFGWTPNQPDLLLDMRKNGYFPLPVLTSRA
jgi:nucleoside-diphosphate-sugar epimerase